MWDYLTSPVAQAIYWLAVAVILCLAGWSYVTGWRNENVGDSNDEDVLAKMRELRRQGVLEEDEFRTIKSNISDSGSKKS